MGDKQKIFSKLNVKEYMKDYKNDLELILDEKKFDEEAKSLLLSIFYKLDNFYNDYSAVKKESKPKNEFLENYINIIKTKCKQIKIVSPKDWNDNVKYKVEKQSGKIECIPNENYLFYAIYELNEKKVIKDKFMFEDFTNECVNYVLNKGKTINSTEVLRDFNGWSWNPQIENEKNIVYNLIFQNLVLLYGIKFLELNIGKNNIVKSLRDKMSKSKIGESGDNFLKLLFQTCIVLYANESEENYDKCLKFKKTLSIKINMLNNRKEDAKDKYNNSSDISKKIKNIDEMLQDIHKIREEFKKEVSINKDEYFCISEYVESKENEKADLLKKIKENNKLLGTKKYITEQDEYTENLSLYEMIKDSKKEVNIQEKIIDLQKYFLKCYKTSIDKKINQKDYYTLVTETRYYANVLLSKGKSVISNEQISKSYEELEEQLINKMIIDNYIDLGFQSKKLNFDILKYIFKTKIIELNNLVIKLIFNNQKLEVEYNDGNMLESKASFEIPPDEELINKKDKKIKLFK